MDGMTYLSGWCHHAGTEINKKKKQLQECGLITYSDHTG